MDKKLSILLVEDDLVDQIAFKRFVAEFDLPYDYQIARSVAEAERLLAQAQPDVVIVDYRLGAGTAFDLLEPLTGTPFLIITGGGDEAIAVESMKAGAIDYLVKDAQGDYLRTLPIAIERAVRLKRAEEEATQYREHLEELVRSRTKQLEEVHSQLLLAQKMESMGRLAGGIAHDFNNMLTAIVGYGNLIKNELPPDHPVQGDVEQILKAAGRSTQLTRQLLIFSRRQIIVLRPIDLNDLILDMEKMLRRLIREDIELVFLLAQNLKPIKADPGQIEQMITNLLLNARDAMPQGGKLTIETQGTAISEHNTHLVPELVPGQYVVLAIKDAGEGMSPETLEHIFEPFFTTRERGKGTGLGLSSVFGIVKQHSGAIRVTSELKKGSIFNIYLPITEEPLPGAAQQESAEQLPTGNEVILLTEDEPSVRILTARILRGLGYQVLEAANGDEALHVARSAPEQIDLLLTDVVMPQMGGYDLAQKLRNMKPNLRILLVSGYTDDSIVHRSVSDNDVAFLSKPFTLTTLAHSVRKVLEN